MPGALVRYSSGSIYIDGKIVCPDDKDAGLPKALLTSINDDNPVALFSNHEPLSQIEFGPALIVNPSDLANSMRHISARYASPAIIPDRPTDLPRVSVTTVARNADSASGKLGQFRIIRYGGDWTLPLRVHFGLSGSAQQGTDFEDFGHEVTIPANQGTATVSVLPKPTAKTSEMTLTVEPEFNASYIPDAPQIAKITLNGAQPLATEPTPLPINCIAWWKGQNDATDSVGINHGTWSGTADYSNFGEVNYAFSFDGTPRWIHMANETLGLSGYFTVELWFKDSLLTPQAYGGLIAKRPVPYPAPCNFGMSVVGGSPDSILIYFIDNDHYNLGYQYMTLSVPQDQMFHHLAAVVRQYDATYVQIQGYLDGALIKTELHPGLLAASVNNAPITIGASNSTGEWFRGLIDEVTIYDRALDSAEIFRIWDAGTYGKSRGGAPIISGQPMNASVTVGGTATFSVTATGDAPLSYQWYRSESQPVGINSSTLTLSSVQMSDAGHYYVKVSNPIGTVVSSAGILTVFNGTCFTPQLTPVSWWRAEQQSTADQTGVRNGHWQGTGSFALGEVGDAFNFDGTSKYVYGDNPSLNFTSDFSVELWYKDQGLMPGAYGALIGKRTTTVGDPCNFGMTIIGGSPRKLLVYYLDPAFGPFGSFQCLTFAGLPLDYYFHHLAVTFRQASLVPGAETIEVTLYVDGQWASSATLSGSIARTGNTAPVTLGTSNTTGEWFNGLIDEVTLYSGILSASDVASIYGAQKAGKCTTSQSPPTIASQPQNQTVNAWSDATFTVGASGTAPLYYQWRFNGTDIPGANSSTYTRYNIEPTHAGSYSVFVWNSAGNASSSGATLTVTEPDTDSDGLPDWWELKYFGDLSQTGAGDYDSDGVSNSEEYRNSLDPNAGTDYNHDGVVSPEEYLNSRDPNTIVFSASLPNDPVSSQTVNGTISVQKGVPSQMAVVVNAVDHSGANWITFEQNFVASLPATEGRHTIEIGLRGRSSDSEQTWYKATVTRDTTPPVIVITSPVSTSTSIPMIQLQGYSTEPLSSLRFDVSNANGLQSDLQGLVTDQEYDTSVHEYKKNYFQCYDVDLTTGANNITLRATDLAGNTSTVNLNYTLVSDTTAPVVTPTWPQSGMKLCMTTFTLDGIVDDPTATITLTLTPANGPATSYNGVIERDGHFWVENLPLGDGTTTLSIAATDAWNNTSTTTLTVSRSTFGLSVNVDPSQVSEPNVSLVGGIEAADYTVWVNGVKAENYGNATWFVPVVPVNPGGTASFTVNAYPPGQDLQPSSAVSVKSSVDKQFRLYVDHHTSTTTLNSRRHLDFFWNQDGHVGDRKTWSEITWDETSTHDWKDGQASPGTWSRHQTAEGQGSPLIRNDCEATITWPAASYPNLLEGVWNCNPGCLSPRWPEPSTPCIPMEHCQVSLSADLTWGPSLILDGPSLNDFGSGTYHEDYSRFAQSTIKLFTGGKSIPHRQSVVEIYAWASEVTDLRAGCGVAGGAAVPANQTSVGELGKLNDDYTLYAALPDGVTKDVTVKAPPKRYTINLEGGKHELVITCVATTPSNRERTTVGVGEEINLKFDPVLKYNLPLWGRLNGSVWPSQANETLFTAPSNAVQTKVMANFPKPGGGYTTLTTEFKVVEPTGIDHTSVKFRLLYQRGLAGAGMHVTPYLAPTAVSFYRVICWEIGQDATGVWGYFTQFAADFLSHRNHGADQWIPIGQDNAWQEPWDTASSTSYSPPWQQGGGFTWIIPGKWRVGLLDSDHLGIRFSDQVFSMDSSGTMTVTKFGHSVRRAITEDYGTAN